MITRERLTSEINQLQEPYLDFLYRIIRSLMPITSTAVQENREEDSWGNFLQNTYGTFQNTPLERSPQGALEIREV